MINISERANKYAEGKAYNAMTQAIAQAYEEGYREGYKDGTEKVPVEQSETETKFVDLGLPSGTLWAADNEETEDNVLYFPYQETKNYQLPTEEFWNELLESCMWKGLYSSTKCTFYGITCIGPNGKSIYFPSYGYLEDEEKVGFQKVYFWIKNNVDESQKKAIQISDGANHTPDKRVIKMFSGYKLPIRQVNCL